MLGLPNYGSSNWMRAEWDAIELPSQFMENWCWDKEMLKSLSSHIDTGEQIPDDLCDRLISSKNFFSAYDLLRQVELSLMDMELYHGAPRDIDEVVKAVRKEVRISPVYELDRFPNTFSHIFAGGYSAGYYSYKWAEVLSADAYEAFVEAGNIFDPVTGAKFMAEVLEASGKRPMKENFVAFRGRAPSVDSLLRHGGLL
ncbi:MAG: Oligopeptidase A [Parcubacteria group bacterium GW2011_GWA2_47_7]|nr:MAG: Oligopeptidase A [Parcubacteria group bacterium GW2011_GWA2_47_7]